MGTVKLCPMPTHPRCGPAATYTRRTSPRIARARPLLTCAIAEVHTVAPVLANALKVLVLVPPSRAITVTGRARYIRALAHTPTHPCCVARREINSQSVLNSRGQGTPWSCSDVKRDRGPWHRQLVRFDLTAITELMIPQTRNNDRRERAPLGKVLTGLSIVFSFEDKGKKIEGGWHGVCWGCGRYLTLSVTPPFMKLQILVASSKISAQVD